MNTISLRVSEDRLAGLKSAFSGKRIAIIGDLMVDRYSWGKVDRVSPEAPVPVVDVTSESARLGGAANVAHNIQSLGGTALLVGLIGDDHAGGILTGLLREQGLSTDGLVVDGGRRTTEKTRVIAHDQHVVRIDHESRGPCSDETAARIIDVVRSRVDDIDALIFEDYNKGAVTGTVIREIIAIANDAEKVITVDPKFENFLDYKDVTVFKPNRRETEEVLGGRITSTDDIVAAGKKLLMDLRAGNILLTRGADGMSLFEADGSVTHLKTAAKYVKDVSGAGDTVIATMTMALAAGLPAVESAALANHAGGVVVGSLGIVPIGIDELIADLRGSGNSRKG